MIRSTSVRCGQLLLALGCLCLSLQNTRATEPPKVLAGTSPLETQGDITSQLVEGVDRFLLSKLASAPAARLEAWKKNEVQGLAQSLPEKTRREAALRATSQGNASEKPTIDELRRAELARIIGLRDVRVKQPRIALKHALGDPTHYAQGQNWRAYLAEWPVLDGVEATGILVQPERAEDIRFLAVTIPDAGQTPEDMIGLGEQAEKISPVAAALAAVGGQVLVTTPVSRHREARRGRAVMTDQEFLYRSAFELGRHVLGYQVHETLAAVDALRTSRVNTAAQSPNATNAATQSLPVLVVGWGEGGWIALHSAAVSTSIDAVCVSGHFRARESLWQEPIHRNIQSLLLNFGDAELAAMIAPRKVVIDAIPGPSVNIEGQGGAPGKLDGPTRAETQMEFARIEALLPDRSQRQAIELVTPASVPTQAGPSNEALAKTLGAIGVELKDSPLKDLSANAVQPVSPARAIVPASQRRLSMLTKWDRYSQQVLEHAADERAIYWQSLKTDSLENFQTTVEPFRQAFAEDVIGSWPEPMMPAHPRTRLLYDQPKYTGYEVVLDVYADVIAYGILLLPKDLKENERRPCVVFQHGLEGRPQDCITGDHPAYHDVAAKLAEQGFIVFAPQNLYIFQDRFRTLQRKSNPLGKTLFSTIIAQHKQICNWLAQLPMIDGQAIGFYGLSYGGKSAMRIPPLVPQYKLSICSADFNDWVWKNASTHASHSYVWTMEYEIFEFDLGSRFNYAEMATLIAPRPFMVERGHFDGVAPDDRVAAEFAKVRNLYAARLGLVHDARLEWFVGPHTIHGQGTFELLHQKLEWPKR